MFELIRIPKVAKHIFLLYVYCSIVVIGMTGLMFHDNQQPAVPMTTKYVTEQ